MEESLSVIELPRRISCYKLHEDGSIENDDHIWSDFYIDDRQVNVLLMPDRVKDLRNRYGPLVGVMHRRPMVAFPPIYPTRKFILGK